MDNEKDVVAHHVRDSQYHETWGTPRELLLFLGMSTDYLVGLAAQQYRNLHGNLRYLKYDCQMIESETVTPDIHLHACW